MAVNYELNPGTPEQMIAELRRQLAEQKGAVRVLGDEVKAWRTKYQNAQCESDPCPICTACADTDANEIAARAIEGAKV